MRDLIDRQVAIDAVASYNKRLKQFAKIIRLITELPSAQPERLTDDDFETIRIHLNAYKEKLCNQRRWKEAEDYQRLIDRFMSFASAQPEKAQLSKEDATKDATLDCISRQAAIDALMERFKRVPTNAIIAKDTIENLPSAQPEEFEWCHDCKEYDKDRHCCHRWTKVIRQTIEDIKKEQPEIIRCKDCAKHEYCRTSTVWAIPPKDDWFCADAERRTDE